MIPLILLNSEQYSYKYASIACPTISVQFQYKLLNKRIDKCKHNAVQNVNSLHYRILIYKYNIL